MQQSQAEWKIVFFIGAGVYFVGAVVFHFCAEGELQPWAYVDESLGDGADKTNAEKDLIEIKQHEAQLVRQELTFNFDHSKFISKI